MRTGKVGGRLVSRRGQRGAGLDTEARAMARANDLVTLDRAAGQLPPSWVQTSSIA